MLNLQQHYDPMLHNYFHMDRIPLNVMFKCVHILVYSLKRLGSFDVFLSIRVFFYKVFRITKASVWCYESKACGWFFQTFYFSNTNRCKQNTGQFQKSHKMKYHIIISYYHMFPVIVYKGSATIFNTSTTTFNASLEDINLFMWRAS